jgi:DNA-binding response OmpR family regulator
MGDACAPSFGHESTVHSASRSLPVRVSAAPRNDDESPGSSGGEPRAIHFGHLAMIEDQYSVKTQKGSISLTAAEYRVLWKLAKNLGSVVGYAELDRPEASERRVNNRAVQAIVASLRRKLGNYGCDIRTTRDLGYLLVR